MKKKKPPKSTLLADNTGGLRTTKQTQLRPVASAAPHPITQGGGGGWREREEERKRVRDREEGGEGGGG